MGTINEDLTSIKNVEDTLTSNKVSRFAYTEQAYTDNNANGVTEYDYSAEQNIPVGTASVMKVNETVISKGWRSKASSLTRMLMNHFLGRISYNLNKVNDNMSSLLTTLSSHLGSANGIATLDANGRIPYSQLPESAVEYKGGWDADTNTPHLEDGVGTNGDMYKVEVAGTQDLGSGDISFFVNDQVIYNGSVWQKFSGGSVLSVNNVQPDSNTGNITLTGEDIDTSSTDSTKVSASISDLQTNKVNKLSSELSTAEGGLQKHERETATNLNDYTVDGFYSLYIPTTTTNRPSGVTSATYGMLAVHTTVDTNNSKEYNEQLLYVVGTGKVYTRYRTLTYSSQNTTWSSWNQVAIESEITSLNSTISGVSSRVSALEVKAELSPSNYLCKTVSYTTSESGYYYIGEMSTTAGSSGLPYPFVVELEEQGANTCGTRQFLFARSDGTNTSCKLVKYFNETYLSSGEKASRDDSAYIYMTPDLKAYVYLPSSVTARIRLYTCIGTVINGTRTSGSPTVSNWIADGYTATPLDDVPPSIKQEPYVNLTGQYWDVLSTTPSTGGAPLTKLVKAKNGIMMAITESNLYISTDGGANWTSKTFSEGEYIKDIIYYEPLDSWFVLITNSFVGLVLQSNSTDLFDTYHYQNSGTLHNNYADTKIAFTDTAYGYMCFVTGSKGIGYFTYDETNPQNPFGSFVASSITTSGYENCIIAQDTTYCMVACGGSGVVYCSTNSSSPTFIVASDFTNVIIEKVKYVEGKYYFFSYSAFGLKYCTDFNSISTATGISSSDYMHDIKFANGMYVAVGRGVYYSSDGINFTQCNGSTSSMNLSEVNYYNGKWLAFEESSGLWYSMDGLSWLKSSITYKLKDSIFTNHTWFAIGSSSGLYNLSYSNVQLLIDNGWIDIDD